jgi:hypothetical protein
MRYKEEDPYDLNVEMIQDNHLHTYDEGKVSGADDNSFENENDTIMKMMNQYMIIIMKLMGTNQTQKQNRWILDTTGPLQGTTIDLPSSETIHTSI